MMIVDMNIDPWPLGNNSKRTDTGRLANINKDQAGDSVQINVANTLETKSILRAIQKILAQATFLATGETMTASG